MRLCELQENIETFFLRTLRTPTIENLDQIIEYFRDVNNIGMRRSVAFSFQHLHKYKKPAPALFIGGAARSGTTLLQGLICSDKACNDLLPESAPIRIQCEAYRTSVQFTKKFPNAYFKDEKAIRNLFEQVLRTLIAQIPAAKSTKYLALKEPALTPYFFELSQILPDARFIYIIRDPRDIAASMRKWGEKAKARGENHFYNSANTQELAKHIDDFLKQLSTRTLPYDRTFILRYEDLVAQPQLIMEELSQFIGRPISAFQLQDSWGGKDAYQLTSQDGPVKDAITPLYGAPPKTDRVHKFAETLSDDDIRIIEDVCATQMKAFGYPSYFQEQEIKNA